MERRTVLILFSLVCLLGGLPPGLEAAGAGEEAGRAGVDLENFQPERIIPVSTLDTLLGAIAAARPGDLIQVADGDYENTEPIHIFNKQGSAQAPIVLRAANRGQARITGQGGFHLENCAYVVVEGFSIFSRDVEMACRIEDAQFCRFTRNHIRVREIPETEPQARRLHWAGITGDNSHHNRIDHNLFEEKRNGGVMIFTGGSSEATGNQSTRYDRIDHNHFRNFHRGQGNGFETIRLGSGTYSHSRAYTIVEYNLFERCNGEAEIISVKTCDNTIRHNTFRNSRGMLTLRNSHQCLVEGNFFISDGTEADSSGVRFFGQGHVIINNYFEGLGEAAVLIRTGDIERRTEPKWKYERKDSGLGDYGAYQRPEKTLIAFNTIVNCGVAFELGGSESLVKRYPLHARQITVANNLVVSGRRQVNRDQGHWEDFTFEGNLFFSTHVQGEAGWNLPPESFRWMDPRLQRRDGLMVPDSNSPAVDAASGDYPRVSHDMQGQLRKGIKDVGADEVSPDGIRFRPLQPRDVGPASL